MGDGRAARKRVAGAVARGRVSSGPRRLQEARWQAVLDNARDAIISIDRRGSITLFNRSAEEIFGYSAAEVLGEDVALLMPSPYRESHRSFLEAYEKTGVGKAIGNIRKVEARRKSGEVFPVELSVSEARIGKDVVYTAILRDISRRLQIEEALRSERDFAERLVDTAPVVVLLLDAEGRIVRFNPCMEEISGYRLEEVQGKDWFATFLPGRDRERIRARFAEGKRAGYAGGLVNAILTKQGAEREIAWHSRRLYDAANEVVAVLSIGEDITDRRRTERRLAAQHAVTRVLAEATSLAEATPRILQVICEALEWTLGELWHVDPSANVLRWDGYWYAPPLDGLEFEAVSRSLLFSPGVGLAGRVRETGQPYWTAELALDESFVRKPIAQKLGLRGACAFPLRKGNEVVGIMVFFCSEPYEPDDELLRMLDAVGRQIGDFMQRRRAEEALFESERRFSEFMNHLPGVAFIKDLDGHYLYVNRTFEQLFHRPLEQVLGKKDEDLWPPDFTERFRRNDSKVIETRQPIQVAETVPHDDGVHEWLSTKFPIFNAAGQPVMVGGVAVDVTEQKSAEAQLRDLEKVTLRRERLADIGAITAQIVHDLGNPLAAISMQAQLILRRARRDDAQPVGTVLKPAEQIVSKVHDLDALIREFLDFAREQRLNLAPLDLRRFLQDIADLWHPVAAERGIRLTLQLPDANPTLIADEEKLRRVFENLLKNAVEAIDQGPGLIHIDVAFPVPDKLRISITDTGPGIPQDLEVFRLFETTKPHGSGLGLPIVRQIILAHGGGIEFAATQPHGTVFAVDLPFQPPAG